jgi:hypothetical protein
MAAWILGLWFYALIGAGVASEARKLERFKEETALTRFACLALVVLTWPLLLGIKLAEDR